MSSNMTSPPRRGIDRMSVGSETPTNTSPLAIQGKSRHFLKTFQAIPGNKQCVDCKQPQPTWASVSLGCLVCLECSGKHRSLGVQYSFVRSVDLDDWNPEQIEFMQHGGNTKLIEFFEKHNVDKDMPLAEKYRSVTAESYRRQLVCKVKGLPPPAALTEVEITQIEDDMQKIKEGLKPKLKPQWTPDNTSNVCEECFRKFNLFRRRHHCRKCGRLVCENCAPRENCKPILPLGIRESVRHCLKCYQPPGMGENAHIGSL
eukprot:m.20437 g.20437  ORF g.20437 m.20437 type:complete len:259 (-) comp12942_c0_seq1:494-1270(-)